MSVKKSAVIDIGSNTILLTIAYVESGRLKTCFDEGDVTRLGEGLKDNSPLLPEAKNRVLKTLEHFKQEAERLGVDSLLAAGTAAFRRASDGADFAEEIAAKLKIPIRILKGEEEARYSYLSARLDFESTYGPIGMIDIGGGSTEFVWSDNGPFLSLPVGTVRFTEDLGITHPILNSQWEQLKCHIQKCLRQKLPLPSIPKRTWAAVAATPASLASVLLSLTQYDPKKIHGFILNKAALESLNEKLRSLSISERISLPGMHPKRAELLPIGGMILSESMSALGIDSIVVSDHGLRYGILWELLITQPA